MTGPAGRARRPGLPRWLGTVRGRRQARASERVRRPQPLLKQRLPSGRGAMEQPNITSGGAGVLTPRFWAMVVPAGIAAGLLGALMMAILFNVQYAAFGYHEGSLQHGVEQASAARRVGSLLVAGVFGGVAWFLLRRYTKGEPSEIDEALWTGDGRLSLKPLVTAMCLGSGASGGLFTPTLATGAVLGGALGIAWNLAWPGSPSGAFAMVGAAAMIGAAMQAPLSGLALVLELTHSGFGLMVPMMTATGIATLVAFHVDGYSIYSARLPAYTENSAPAAPADGRTDHRR